KPTRNRVGWARMFAAVAAASPGTMMRPGMYASPRKPKTTERSIATPAARAYRRSVPGSTLDDIGGAFARGSVDKSTFTADQYVRSRRRFQVVSKNLALLEQRGIMRWAPPDVTSWRLPSCRWG